MMSIDDIKCKNVNKEKENELMKASNYGTKINVNGHDMVVKIVGELNETTIILLPGFPLISPVLHFKPLAEALSDKYKIITVEPFGYGFSDYTNKERKVENIVSELHICIKQLGTEKYYLLAHSLSGIYSLYWSNQYPSEVLGFIGIDNSVPTIDRNYIYKAQYNLADKLMKLKKQLGFFNIENYFSQKYKKLLDSTYHYTDNELKTLKYLYSTRNGNDVFFNEFDNMNYNYDIVENMKFPSTVPVLNLMVPESGLIPYDASMYYKLITEKNRSKVIEFKGSHYLHIEQKDIVVEIIKKWII